MYSKYTYTYTYKLKRKQYTYKLKRKQYTYKLKGKQFFDSWVLCELNIYGQEKWVKWTQLEVTMYSKYTTHIS